MVKTAFLVLFVMGHPLNSVPIDSGKNIDAMEMCQEVKPFAQEKWDEIEKEKGTHLGGVVKCMETNPLSTSESNDDSDVDKL